MAARKKYDYDSDDFYRSLQESAERQMREHHIVWDKVLAKDLGIDSRTFSEMKNGCYRGWTPEENERRKIRIYEVCARVRACVEPEIWKMIIDIGLGNVQAQDISFLKIDGEVSDEQRITVHKLPPNLAALQLWLKHHSKEYRDIEKGIDPEEDNAEEGSVAIEKWIKDNTE